MRGLSGVPRRATKGRMALQPPWHQRVRHTKWVNAAATAAAPAPAARCSARCATQLTGHDTADAHAAAVLVAACVAASPACQPPKPPPPPPPPRYTRPAAGLPAPGHTPAATAPGTRPAARRRGAHPRPAPGQLAGVPHCHGRRHRRRRRSACGAVMRVGTRDDGGGGNVWQREQPKWRGELKEKWFAEGAHRKVGGVGPGKIREREHYGGKMDVAGSGFGDREDARKRCVCVCVCGGRCGRQAEATNRTRRALRRWEQHSGRRGTGRDAVQGASAHGRCAQMGAAAEQTPPVSFPFTRPNSTPRTSNNP
eukprot:240863-Chlamydomonas_euryale.AAC.3